MCSYISYSNTLSGVIAQAKALRESLQGWTPPDPSSIIPKDDDYSTDSASMEADQRAPCATISQQQRERCRRRRELQRQHQQAQAALMLLSVKRLQRAFRTSRARRRMEMQIARTNAATRAAAVAAALAQLDIRLWRLVDLRAHLISGTTQGIEACFAIVSTTLMKLCKSTAQLNNALHTMNIFHLRGQILQHTDLSNCFALLQVVQRAWRAHRCRLLGRAFLVELRQRAAAAQSAAAQQEREWQTHIEDRNELEQQSLRAWRWANDAAAVQQPSPESRLSALLAVRPCGSATTAVDVKVVNTRSRRKPHSSAVLTVLQRYSSGGDGKNVG
jgi:hypothetical protein